MGSSEGYDVIAFGCEVGKDDGALLNASDGDGVVRFDVD